MLLLCLTSLAARRIPCQVGPLICQCSFGVVTSTFVHRDNMFWNIAAPTSKVLAVEMLTCIHMYATYMPSAQLAERYFEGRKASNTYKISKRLDFCRIQEENPKLQLSKGGIRNTKCSWGTLVYSSDCCSQSISYACKVGIVA
jgi:hypothetical protein